MLDVCCNYEDDKRDRSNTTYDEEVTRTTQRIRHAFYCANSDLLVLALFCVGYVIYLSIEDWSFVSGSDVIPIIIAVLIVIFIVTFAIGTFGSYKLSHALLITYCVLITLLIIADIVLIYLFASDDMWQRQSFLRKRWESLSVSEQRTIEDRFDCCTFDNDTTNETDCDSTVTTQTCYSALRKFVNKQLWIIIVAACFFAVLQILALILASLLLRRLREYKLMRCESQHGSPRHRQQQSVLFFGKGAMMRDENKKSIFGSGRSTFHRGAAGEKHLAAEREGLRRTGQMPDYIRESDSDEAHHKRLPNSQIEGPPAMDDQKYDSNDEHEIILHPMGVSNDRLDIE